MSRYVVTATWEDVPHLPDAVKAELAASIPPWQRDARMRGVPQLGAGAIYPVVEADVQVEDFVLPAHWPRCYGLDVMAVQLDDPVDAVRRWSHDISLRTRVPIVSGPRISAVELQLLILEQAKRFCDAGGCDGFVPRAGEILRLWEDTLFKLKVGPIDDESLAALAPRLDWALKLKILKRAMKLHPGLTWNSPGVRHLDRPERKRVLQSERQQDEPKTTGSRELAIGRALMALTHASAVRYESGCHRAWDLIERVVVTASRQQASETAGSVHYLDESVLEQHLYADVNRILRQVPGLNLVEEEGFGIRPSIGIRGSGTDRNSKIAVLEDGVPIAPAPYSAPSAYYFPRTPRMHAIEVSKGHVHHCMPVRRHQPGRGKGRAKMRPVH